MFKAGLRQPMLSAKFEFKLQKFKIQFNSFCQQVDGYMLKKYQKIVCENVLRVVNSLESCHLSFYLFWGRGLDTLITHTADLPVLQCFYCCYYNYNYNYNNNYYY